jgi:phosphoglycolate phosphatase
MMHTPLALRLVFDIDGTLASTADYWLPVLEESVRRIELKHGFSHSLPQLSDALSLLGKPDTEIFSILYPQLPADKIQSLIDYANEVWTEMLPQHPYRIFDGVAETLASLHDKGHRLFLASNCDSNYLNQLPAETGIAHFFTDGACLGHFPHFEKWEFTREMLSRHAPGHGVFIGDSSHDMIAGRKNGLVTVHAAYGYAHQPDDALIDHAIQDIRELPELLDSIYQL